MNAIAAIREFNKALTPNHRCSICRDYVKRRAHEIRRDWLRRKTCEKPGCKAAMDMQKTKNASKARKAAPPRVDLPASKQCPVCDVTFFRREDERKRNWLDRKTCCTEHQYILQGQTRKHQYHKDDELRLDDMLVSYGAGFGSQDIDPGDGGPIRLSKPDYQTYGGVGRW